MREQQPPTGCRRFGISRWRWASHKNEIRGCAQKTTV